VNVAPNIRADRDGSKFDGLVQRLLQRIITPGGRLFGMEALPEFWGWGRGSVGAGDEGAGKGEEVWGCGSERVDERERGERGKREGVGGAEG
jgi:hypothetical protein